MSVRSWWNSEVGFSFGLCGQTKGSVEPPITRKNSPQNAFMVTTRDLGKTSLAEQKGGWLVSEKEMARMKIRVLSVVEMKEEVFIRSCWVHDKGLVFFQVDKTHSVMVNPSAFGFITLMQVMESNQVCMITKEQMGFKDSQYRSHTYRK